MHHSNLQSIRFGLPEKPAFEGDPWQDSVRRYLWHDHGSGTATTYKQLLHDADLALSFLTHDSSHSLVPAIQTPLACNVYLQ